MADAPASADAPTPADASTDVAAAAPASPPSSPSPAPVPVVVKKYANRRLYNTETSSYITLDNLADMIRAGRDFVVYDAKSGEDITRGVLTQIIVEEESKGTSMLPTPFLRQLIGFYGDSLQGVVPRYLETAMSSFARQQQQLRQAVQQTISPFLPAGVEEMGRQNLAMIERAMSMFNPFHRGTEPLPPAPPASADSAELDRLRGEVDALRAQLAAAQAGPAAPDAPAAPASPDAPDAPAAALESFGAPMPDAVLSAVPALAPAPLPDPGPASLPDPRPAPLPDPGPVASAEPAASAQPDAPLSLPAGQAAPALASSRPAQAGPGSPAAVAKPPHLDASMTEQAIHHAVDALASQAPKPGSLPAPAARRGRAQRGKN